MNVLILSISVIILLFGTVVLRGAPYLPTLQAQQKTAIELLALKKGQTLLELGSGDGRLLAYAASHGINAVGIELNPLLVLWTRVRYWRYRRRIKVYWGDFWLKDWPKTDGLYVFLLDRYMEKLHKKITQQHTQSGFKVVSYTFKIPNKEYIRTKNGLYLYIYD